MVPLKRTQSLNVGPKNTTTKVIGTLHHYLPKQVEIGVHTGR